MTDIKLSLKHSRYQKSFPYLVLNFCRGIMNRESMKSWQTILSTLVIAPLALNAQIQKGGISFIEQRNPTT